MLSIGELARASGLTVSALRFYDGAGVLAPVAVDPHTGYRWYAHDQLAPARLVAGLRRVGMPLPEIATAVRHWGDNGTVADLLAAHLRRLEEGLADAKQEISRLRSLLTDEEPHMSTIRLTIARDEFAAALAAVRFAVGADPDLPMINGVLVDVEPDAIRLVATDRYRLAVAEVPARVTGPGGRHLLPTGFVDRIAPLLAEAGEETVTLLLADGRVTLGAAGTEIAADCPDAEFPDYRRLLREALPATPRHRVTVDAAGLRAALGGDGAGLPPVVALTVDDRGAVGVSPAEAAADNGTLTAGGTVAAGSAVGVNPEFLLEAVAAGGDGQLMLELDGPIRPLAVRRADDTRAFSMLMPIRLDQPLPA